MWLSEICKICEEETIVLKEGNFETVKLLGKEKVIPKSAVTFLGEKKYIDCFFLERIECVICTEEIAKMIESIYNGGIAISQNPKTSFFEIHNYVARKDMVKSENSIDETAIIHPTAIIEEADIKIGKNTVIGAYSVIKRGTTIGNDCIIREHVIIGTPAFYYYGKETKKRLVESTGGVRIGNNVELHPHTVIEKGVIYGDTVIGNNTKIDNLVLVGHDSKIGKNCIIAAGTTFAGGVDFGVEAFAGVGVVIAPNVNIGNGAKLSSGAVVTKNVSSNEHVSGNFAVPHNKLIQHIKRIIK